MNRRQFGLLGLSTFAVLSIIGCSQDNAQTAVLPPEAAAMTPARQYRLAAQAHGFSVGPLVSVNSAYVFFDPLCVHCSELWNNLKSFSGKAHVIWVPTGLLSGASMHIGAGILAAANPVVAMNEHETQLARSRGRIEIKAGAHPDEERQVSENTRILKQMNAQGVPLILYRNAAADRYETFTGGRSIEQLAEMFER